MSVTEHVLSGNIADLVGDAVDPTHTIAWVETNVEGNVIVDTGTSGSIRVGAPRVTIEADGDFSVSLAPTAGATNPTGFQYRFWIEYRNVFGGVVKKSRWNSGWFSHTTAQNLKDVAGEQYVPPTYMSTAIETLQGYVDLARDISNIATPDEVVATLVELADSLTRAALSAGFIERSELAAVADPAAVAAYLTGVEAAAQVAAQIISAGLLGGVSASWDNNQVFSIVDKDGRMSWVQIAPDGGTTDAARNLFTQGRLPISATFAAGMQDLLAAYAAGGWAYLITDNADRIAFGIKLDGTVVANLAPGVDTGIGFQATPVGDGTTTVIPYLDAITGKRQLKARNRASASYTIIGDPAKDNVDPRVTGDAVLFTQRNGSTWEKVWTPTTGGTVGPMESRLPIVGWGTSLMQGVVGTVSIMQRIATNLGLTYSEAKDSAPASAQVLNLGISGSSSVTNAARQGGRPATLTVVGGSIPATTTAVEVVHTNSALQWAMWHSLPAVKGTLAGVHGTLVGVNTPDSNDPAPRGYFTRDTAGSAVAVSGTVSFIPDIGTATRGTKQIYWLNRNNPDATQNAADVAAMIAYSTAYANDFLIIGEINAQAAAEPTRSAMEATNAAMLAAYPGKYVDLHAYLRDYGLAAAGLTPTAQDTIDIAANKLPARISYDGTHLTGGTSFPGPGYQVAGDYITSIIVSKGWLS